MNAFVSSLSVTLGSPMHYWRRADLSKGSFGLAVADLSFFVKIGVRGRGVAELARRLASDGAACRPLGVSRIAGANRALACRLTEDHLLMLGAEPVLEVRVDGFAARANALELEVMAPGENLLPVNQTSAFAGFALVGADWDSFLASLTSLDLARSLPEGGCVQTNLAGVSALLVRIEEAPFPSLRVYVSPDVGEYLLESLCKATGERMTVMDAAMWRDQLAE